MGRSGGGGASAARHAALVQRPRGAPDRRAGIDAAGRGRLLPVGQAGVRPVLGVLERLALLGLLAYGHGDLTGPADPVPAVLRAPPPPPHCLAPPPRPPP